MEYVGLSIENDERERAEAMKEREGLGTPATRAETIEKLMAEISFNVLDQVVFGLLLCTLNQSSCSEPFRLNG